MPERKMIKLSSSPKKECALVSRALSHLWLFPDSHERCPPTTCLPVPSITIFNVFFPHTAQILCYWRMENSMWGLDLLFRVLFQNFLYWSKLADLPYAPFMLIFEERTSPAASLTGPVVKSSYLRLRANLCFWDLQHLFCSHVTDL